MQAREGRTLGQGTGWSSDSDLELEEVTPGQRLEGGWQSGEGREKERKVQAEETATAAVDIEYRELVFIVGGNAKWFSCFGRKFGSFLQNVST